MATIRFEQEHAIGSIVLANPVFGQMIGTFGGGHFEMSAARSGVTQELSTAYFREIFENLESGDGKGFFGHVSDDVDWIVEGTHPLAGHYHSKAEFLAHTFEAREGSTARRRVVCGTCTRQW